MRALAALLLLSLPALAQDWTPDQRNVRIPMRDGESLAADVFLPRKPGRYPTVLVQTPYDKNRIGAALPGGDGKVNWIDRSAYAYVVTDWRGFHASKAAGVGRRRDLGLDGYDTVEWIARQAWSDGKVGTWGGSALGKAQFDTAAKKPPHLVCAVPLIAAMGQDYRAYYPGGVLLEAHIKKLDQLGFGLRRFVTRFPLPDARIWKAAKRRSYRVDLIDVPMLLVTGWWDNYPALILENFEDLLAMSGPTARAHARILVGPWDHMSVGKRKQGDLEFPAAEKAAARAVELFFDYWLRDRKDNGWDKGPRVTYYELGTDKWITADAWPKPGATKSLYLHDRGALVPDRQAGMAGRPRSFKHDPEDPVPTVGGANLPPLGRGPKLQNELEKRVDVLVYGTGPLREPLRVFGPVEVELHFRCNRKDVDLGVRLCVVDGKGDSYLLGDAMQRAKLRDGGAPSLLEPGRAYTLTVKLPPTAIALLKGQQLRVLVSASNWPRYERNTHTGADHFEPESALDVEVTILPGSRVLVPTAK